MARGTNYFLRTFDVATQAVRQTISHGTVDETYPFAALSPDGQTLAVGLADGALTFSDAKTGDVMETIPDAYPSSFFQLAFSPNGKLLASAGRLALSNIKPSRARKGDWDAGSIPVTVPQRLGGSGQTRRV